LAYRAFLNRLAEPLKQRLSPFSRGLDFGSGPGPTLSLMLEESGHSMRLYDSHYASYKSALCESYDFITATEVVEHLAAPGAELQRLWDLLVPGGWLAVMTKLVIDRARFSRWHYRRDPTHISFFCRYTWDYIARQWATTATYIGSDVILIQKGNN
jgi:SAM-dependent methyltransferase